MHAAEHSPHVLTTSICSVFCLVHRRHCSRGDGMDALIGERLEHGVYNLRL